MSHTPCSGAAQSLHLLAFSCGHEPRPPSSRPPSPQPPLPSALSPSGSTNRALSSQSPSLPSYPPPPPLTQHARPPVRPPARVRKRIRWKTRARTTARAGWPATRAPRRPTTTSTSGFPPRPRPARPVLPCQRWRPPARCRAALQALAEAAAARCRNSKHEEIGECVRACVRACARACARATLCPPPSPPPSPLHSSPSFPLSRLPSPKIGSPTRTAGSDLRLEPLTRISDSNR